MTAKLRPYDEPPPRRRSLIPSAPGSAATAFLVFAILWLVAATGIGAAWALVAIGGFSLQLPLALGFTLELDAARVEMTFRSALVYGWLGNVGFAAICFITPRLVGRPLAGEPIGVLAAVVWNLLALAPGLATLYLFDVLGRPPLTEFPFPVDGALLLALAMVNAVFWMTLMGARQVYVSAWFFAAGLLGFTGLVAIGILPEALGVRAETSALIGRFVSDGIDSFWVLGIALGVLHYVVPRAAGVPLHSSGLAALTFGTWLVLAGPSAARGLIGEGIPYGIATLGIVSTMLLVVPAFLAVTNLLLSLRGRFGLTLGAGTIGFAALALAFLAASPLLHGIGALRPTQALLSATDWYLGAALLSALGVATFAHFSFADHALPRLLRRSWRGGPLTAVQMWAVFVGVALAAPMLMLGGIAHGSMLLEQAAAEEIDAVLLIFRVVAAGGLGLANLGALALLVNAFLMYTSGRPASYALPEVDAPPAEGRRGPMTATAGR